MINISTAIRRSYILSWFQTWTLSFLILGLTFTTSHAQVSITGDVNPNPAVNPTWNVGGILFVGQSGTGTMTVDTDGTVSNTSGRIGLNAGSNGTVTVSGGNWTNSGQLFVGFFGTGILSISNGGTVSNTFGFIGHGTGSDGTVTVSGGTWTNSDLLVVGNAGTGSLSVSGGTVTATSVSMGNNGGAGTVNLNGGVLATGQVSEGIGTGTVTFSGGTLRLTGNQGDLFAGFEAGDVTLVGAGGTIDTQTFSVASAYGLSGNGSLTKQGNGTLTLTGTNTYTGGTTVRNGALTVTGGISHTSATMTVGNSSGDNASLNISGTGTVSNTSGFIGNDTGSNGTVTVSGGTWANSNFLFVGNSGDGTLNLSGGTVSNTRGLIGNDTGSNGTVTVSGGNWTNSDQLFVGNAGTGSLSVSNGTVSNTSGRIGNSIGSNGTVTVSGGNWTNSDFLLVGNRGTGSLSVSGGTVSATSVRMGERAGSTGTLNIGTGGTAGTLSTDSVRGGLGTAVVNFNHTGNLTFNPILEGSLTVNKLAAGTTTLTAENTYTGGTTVSAGTLLANNTVGSATGTGLVSVASGATLGGNGTIGGSVNVDSGGIFSPGNNTGILTVGPLTLQSGSTTRMEINGTTPGTGHDQIWVNGSATLNGTLDLLFGFVPVVGNSFTLIQANSFTLAGNAATGFSDIQTNLGAALLANVVINSTTFNIEIALSQKDFVPFAGTPNQRAVARNLDLFSTTGEDQPLIDFLNTLLAGQLPGAFDQIAPEELALLGEMGFANSRDIFRILNNRGNEIQNSQQFSNNGLGFWDSGKEFQQNLFAGSGDPVAGGQLFVPKADDRRLGFFVSGQGTFGDYDGDGNGDSYDFSTGGIILGGDYRLTENAAVGLYAGYQGSEANTSASSKIGSDSAKFGAYGTWWHEKGSWVSANIGGGAHSYDSDRVSLGGNATGSTNGTEINTQLALGQNFKAGKNKEWTFGPEAELGYTHLWIDGFTESGSLAPLSIGDRDADSLRSTLAAKVSYDWKIQTWTLRPYARVGWQHEFMDDNGSVNARLASGAGNFFTVQGSDIARDSVVAGAGAQLLFSDAISALLGYSAEANSDYEIHSINGSMNFRF